MLSLVAFGELDDSTTPRIASVLLNNSLTSNKKQESCYTLSVAHVNNKWYQLSLNRCQSRIR